MALYVNIHRGLGNNIPNDNLVEIFVQMVKKKVHAQGSNATYESSRRASMNLQIQDEIQENMKKECEVKVHGRKRPKPS